MTGVQEQLEKLAGRQMSHSIEYNMGYLSALQKCGVIKATSNETATLEIAVNETHFNYIRGW